MYGEVVFMYAQHRPVTIHPCVHVCVPIIVNAIC